MAINYAEMRVRIQGLEIQDPANLPELERVIRNQVQVALQAAPRREAFGFRGERTDDINVEVTETAGRRGDRLESGTYYIEDSPAMFTPPVDPETATRYAKHMAQQCSREFPNVEFRVTEHPELPDLSNETTDDIRDFIARNVNRWVAEVAGGNG